MQKNKLNNGKKLINLTFDAAFKLYFKRGPGLLKSLLEAFLPLPKNSTIDNVEVLDSESSSTVSPPSKNFILDLKVRIKRRVSESTKIEIVNVEMQTSNLKDFTSRMLCYNDRLFSDQLKPGEGYGSLRTVYTLVFITDNLRELAVKEFSEKYYHVCLLRADAPPFPVISYMKQLIIVELAKFKKSLHRIN